MNRAFIYARYSTDLQNEKSVEDQIALCKSYARNLGLAVVGSDHDRAKSGASTFGRPGLTRILEAAKSGTFEVLISEAPDRISRDMADLAGIHKALEFRGIEMNCVNGGRMADILVTRDALPDLELIGTFRSLVESVIVRPRKAGEEYEVSIRGYLASLMGAEMSALPMVAGERYIAPPTYDNALFSYRRHATTHMPSA